MQKRTYDRGSARIAGYGHPLYDEDTPTSAAGLTPSSDEKLVAVELPLLKNGSVSNAVKNAQALLIQHGYACGGRIVAGREIPDGEYGPTTEESVKRFQELKNLTVDGSIGSETWKTLLTC